METSSFVTDNDLGSLQNAGLVVEETSSAESSSIDLLTTPKSDLKTSEFSKSSYPVIGTGSVPGKEPESIRSSYAANTNSSGREALQRQINLLELGNREQIANANAKYRAYQDKIEYLESVVSNLKLDQHESGSAKVIKDVC
jgi:hypothetical protein